MRLFISTVLLGAVLSIPTGMVSVSGGAGQCDGTAGVLTCTEVNGANCDDIANVWKAANEDTSVKKSTATWKCADENNNEDCSGTAKKISTDSCI